MLMLRTIVLLALVVFTGGMLLVAQPAESRCPVNYAGLLLPRLTVGLPARVVEGGVPNRVRSQPSTSGPQIGMLAPGTAITVLEGPVCAGGILWWQVSDGRLTGWTAEGLDGVYFLEPTSAEGIAQAATLAAAVTATEQAVLTAAEAAVQAQMTEAAQYLLTATLLMEAYTATAISREQTAQASITPSATPTITLTPTITPTPEPPQPLPIQRTVISAANFDQLTLLSRIIGAGNATFSGDGSQVLAGGQVYDLPALTPADDFVDFPLAIGWPVTFSPDRSCTLFIAGDGAWRMYDAATGEVASIDDISPRGSQVAVSNGPVCRLGMIFGENYGNPVPPQLAIWSMDARRVTVNTSNNNQFMANLTFNRDGSLLAVNGTVRLIQTDRLQWRVPGAGYSTNGGVAFRPVPPGSPEQLAFGGGSGVLLLDLTRGTARDYAITGGTMGFYIRFSPDGALMGVITETSHGAFDAPPDRFNVFDVETGALLLDADPPRDFAFSPDGTLLVIVDHGGNVNFYGVP